MSLNLDVGAVHIMFFACNGGLEMFNFAKGASYALNMVLQCLNYAGGAFLALVWSCNAYFYA